MALNLEDIRFDKCDLMLYIDVNMQSRNDIAVGRLL